MHLHHGCPSYSLYGGVCPENKHFTLSLGSKGTPVKEECQVNLPRNAKDILPHHVNYCVHKTRIQQTPNQKILVKFILALSKH